ncbi:MAG: hypothetical protein A2505_01545 [Deltaproteobacteria bacterium RIFOXYD12_FULL_55_16]|nr:MAG: hypothetical protein A2505_01545 [Deltaproteobacteria bacterium RIFOXYD12_FULL_55_16]
MAAIFFPGQNLPVTFDHQRKSIQAKLTKIISYHDPGVNFLCFAVTKNLHLFSLIVHTRQETKRLGHNQIAALTRKCFGWESKLSCRCYYNTCKKRWPFYGRFPVKKKLA